MEWERVLAAAGSFASLVGLPVSYLSLKGNVSKSDQALNLFRGMTDLADRWKNIHNNYHIVYQDLHNVNGFLSQYKSVSEVRLSDLHSFLGGCASLRNGCKSFRRDIEVYLKDIRSIVNDSNELTSRIERINSEIGDDYGRKAAKMFNAQADAIESSDQFCKFTDILNSIYINIGERAAPKDFKLIEDIYNNIELYHNAHSQVILKTDIILLNTIDFFRLVARARL